MNQSHAFPQPANPNDRRSVSATRTRPGPWITGHAKQLATPNRILIAAACWPAAKPRADDTMRNECMAGEDNIRVPAFIVLGE